MRLPPLSARTRSGLLRAKALCSKTLCFGCICVFLNIRSNAPVGNFANIRAYKSSKLAGSKHEQARHMRAVARAAACDDSFLPASVTDIGQELEGLLRDAQTVAEGEFDRSLHSLISRGKDGGVCGLRAWLSKLGLSQHRHDVVSWIERMGACELDEVVENAEDLAADLGLHGESLDVFLREAEPAAVTVQNSESFQPGKAHEPLSAAEMDDTLQHLLLKWSDREVPFHRFDERLRAVSEQVRNDPEADASSLEDRFASELRDRLRGDLQYLLVVRSHLARNLPELPAFRSPLNKTWAFCGGDEKWIVLADEMAFPVHLSELTRPTLVAMRHAVLGGADKYSKLLDTYISLEFAMLHGKLPPEGLPFLEIVNVSRLAVNHALQGFAGASGLPDRNRTMEEAPVPLGLTKEALEDKDEAALQVAQLGEVMANTRVGQADSYFRHVLFGLLLCRLRQRFELLRNAGLLPPISESLQDRMKLEQQAAGMTATAAEACLEELQFEAFTASLVAPSEGSSVPALYDLLDLSPTMLRSVRRNIDEVFGQGLREEIFVHLARASRASARQGEVAAGPQVCATFLLEAARNGELRMLSAGPKASERLAWHGLLFGVLLQENVLLSA